MYCGFPTEDSSHFDLSQYFKPAADFIHKALKTKDGRGTLMHVFTVCICLCLLYVFTVFMTECVYITECVYCV